LGGPEISQQRRDTPLIALGRDDRDAGRTISALRKFEEATATCPDDPEGYVETATTLREMRLISQAREKLDSVLPRWPNRWDVLIELARAASAGGDTTTALQAYEKVIQLAPEAVWAEPYIGAATQLRMHDRLEDADAVLNRGITVCSQDDAQRAFLLEAKALVLTAADKQSEATATLDTSVSLSGRYSRIWDAAAVLTARGEFSNALRLLRDLRSTVQQHCSDSWTYDKYMDAVNRAARLASAIDHRSQYDAHSQLLPLHPYMWTSEHSFSSLAGSVAGRDDAPARYYLLVDTSPEGTTAQAPISSSSVLSQDCSLFYPLRRRQCAHFTYVLPNAHIFDNLGTDPRSIVVFDESAYVPDLTAYHYPAVLGRRALRDLRRAAAEPIELAFMLPPGGGWLNYYHSIAEIFSSLSVYKALDLSCPIVTPGPMGRFHWDLLQFSGIADNTPLLSADQIRDRPIQTIICPEVASGQLLRDWCKTIADGVRAQDGGEGPRVLYISRGHAPGRTLTNEDAIQSALMRYFNAESIYMEDLAFATQVRLANQAEVIIGPHGAGLTNLCFANEDAWLVELIPERHPVPIFRDLAAAVGVHYVPIAGQVDDLETLSWRVDIDRILNVLRAVLGYG
jgi:capsular polysaccharide biosynthesis protein